MQEMASDVLRLLRVAGGKLLVVDFAPHELEFLREQSAHRRLGFARDQIERQLARAGLKLERFRDLAPAPSDGRLTVSLWLAVKPVAAKKKRPANVEVAA